MQFFINHSKEALPILCTTVTVTLQYTRHNTVEYISNDDAIALRDYARHLVSIPRLPSSFHSHLSTDEYSLVPAKTSHSSSLDLSTLQEPFSVPPKSYSLLSLSLYHATSGKYDQPQVIFDNSCPCERILDS